MGSISQLGGMLKTSVRRSVFLAVLALPLLVSVMPASAAAPPVATAAPGFARMQLGGFEVTALSDGTVSLDLRTLLKNVKPARLDADLGAVFLREPVETSVNAYLVNTGSKLVLIDTGAGNLFGPTLGKLGANLKAAGYDPSQIDEIYITHFHADHIGGLIAPDGTAVFPNAIVRADKRESDYWLSDANLNAAPADAKSFFEGARKSLKPYVDAGHYKSFNGATTLVPGIRTIATPGHTPGHTTYVVESKGSRLVLWGDLVHAASVQFQDPNVAIGFDSNTTAAIAARKTAFAEAAAQGTWVGAAHIAFPGIGHVTRTAHGYQWVPANYSPVITGK